MGAPATRLRFVSAGAGTAATTDRRGEYEILLPAGTYEVHCAGLTAHLELPRRRSYRFDLDLPGQAALGGVVLNERTGRPVAGARLLLFAGRRSDDDEALRDAATRSDGRFHLEGLARGRHLLEVSRRGYVTRRLAGVRDEVEVRLRPLSRLVGRLRVAGAPYAARPVEVQLVREDGESSSFELFTDRYGVFVVELPGGLHLVALSAGSLRIPARLVRVPEGSEVSCLFEIVER